MQTLHGAFAKAQELATMTTNFTNKRIPFSTINTNAGFNIRQVYRGIEDVGKPGEEGYEEGLSTAIARDGLMNPLTVRPGKKEGTYDLVAGFRRYKAIQKLGWREVDVRVNEKLSDIEARYANAKENIDREGLPTYDLALWARGTAENFGETQEDIAKRLGKSRSYIGNLIRCIKGLAPEILKEWQKGNPLARTDFLVSLVGLDHDDQIERWNQSAGDAGEDEDGDDSGEDGGAAGGIEEEKKSPPTKRATTAQLEAAIQAISKLAKKNKGNKEFAAALQALKFARGTSKSIPGMFTPEKKGDKE